MTLNNDMIKNKLLNGLMTTLYSTGLFAGAMMLSWLLLSKVNFMYPTLYQWLNIEQTINTYAPQNRFKAGFESTNQAQHIDYFAQITHAINNGGDGLTEISYPVNKQQIPLLHNAEVVHLQDVANLIDKLHIITLLAIGISALALGYFYRLRQAPVPIKHQLLGLGAIVLLLTIVSAVIGFVEVFYWLHQVIFPDNHQWYFYYQDSLMTTLMKAPILFGPISAMLLVLGGLLFVAINLTINAVIRKVG